MKSSRALAKEWPYPRHQNFEERLQQAAKAWFATKGYPIHGRYPYCLDRLDHWKNNVILPEVADYIAQELEQRGVAGKGFPLHKFAHHGLSSQAMIFNLVGPLIVYQDLAPLQQVMEQHGVPWPAGATASFEYEDREVFNEDSGQPTSIDLVIQGDTSTIPLFIESKLVEREFGGCSVFENGDCDGRNPVSDLSQCYLHFIGRKYWELLEKFGFLQGPLCKEKLCAMALHYQFFREALFALAKDGVFILLVDQRNPSFLRNNPHGNRGLIPLLLEFVPEKKREQIEVITIQEVIAAIRATTRHTWVNEFESKYAIYH